MVIGLLLDHPGSQKARAPSERNIAESPVSSDTQQAGSTSSNLATIQAKVRENQKRIAEIDSQIQTANSASQDDGQDQLSRLQSDMAQQQSTIAAIDAQIQTRQTQMQAEQRSAEERAGQQAALFQQQLATMQAQINNQQQLVNAAQQQVRNITAPAGSDVLVYFQNAANEAQDKLTDLQNQYQSLIDQQGESVQKSYLDRDDRIQSQQAGQASLEFAGAQAKAQLQKMNQEYQDLSNRMKTERTGVERLRSEKQTLLQENQLLQQKLGQ